MSDLPDDGSRVRAMTYGNEDEEIAPKHVVGKLSTRTVSWSVGDHVQCFVDGVMVVPESVVLDEEAESQSKTQEATIREAVAAAVAAVPAPVPQKPVNVIVLPGASQPVVESTAPAADPALATLAQSVVDAADAIRQSAEATQAVAEAVRDQEPPTVVNQLPAPQPRKIEIRDKDGNVVRTAEES